MAETVKVIVRCRPLNRREKDLKCGTVVDMDDKTGHVSLRKPGADSKEPPKNFTFDGAFFVDSVTETIYENIAFPLVEGTLEGYNGTVFAYGQTGCGKSFSMTGIEDPPSQRGIIPRAFKHIFEAVASNEEAKFLINGSYLEIYNEEIRDLLASDAKKSKMELKEHPDTGVYVKGLTMITVHSVDEIEQVMETGGKSRSVGATLMNADSSRSHSIFTISLERVDTGADASAGIRAGKLNLVDLAGSERQAKTGATGDRLKEATKINLSLSALGNVISALVDGKAKHIPYRDSKLTRLLQDSLGGNTKTLMVACCSPADNNYDETLSTLRYANRAKNIKNKPKINEDPKDALLREYSDEITRLKALLSGQGIPTELGNAAAAPVQAVQAQPDHSAELEEARAAAAAAKREADELKQMYQRQVQDMQTSFQAAQDSKEELERNLSTLQKDFMSQEESARLKLVQAEGQLNNLTPAKTAAVLTSEASVGAAGAGQVAGMAVGRSTAGAQTTLPAQGISQGMGPGTGQYTPGMGQSVSVTAQTSPGPGPAAPGHGQAAPAADQAAAMQRLKSLESQLVGGERAGDAMLKENLIKRRRHADEMKEILCQTLEEDADLGVMEAIYDNMQDAIRAKQKQLEKTTVKLRATQSEVEDLQEEFQRDRSDYLETIRNQERTLKLQEQILDAIVPVLRQNCNYKNLDWVKYTSVWVDDQSAWKLPKIELTKTSLPPPVAMSVSTGSSPAVQHRSQSPARGRVTDASLGRFGSGRVSSSGAGSANAPLTSAGGASPASASQQPSMYDGLDNDSRLRSKLNTTQDSSDYFKPMRAAQLVAESQALKTSPAKQQIGGLTPPKSQQFSGLPPPSQLPSSALSSGSSQFVPLPWLENKQDPLMPSTPSRQAGPQTQTGSKTLARHGELKPLNRKGK